jgi:tryptophanyl-tRNA synthetase
MKDRILSGMRPTGRLHIGHYYGALVNWVKLQESHECFYMVADYHSLMERYDDIKNVSRLSVEMVADWIACGLDPDKSTIFIQSDVPQHAELHLILSMVTPVGWLERTPTYKDYVNNMKGDKSPDYLFLGYPVLQAADILLYKARLVPVGEDQVAHLELVRELVRRFNRIFNSEVLVEPQPKLTPTPRILGTDGAHKMSKSIGNTLEIADDPSFKQKVLGMFTDPARKKRQDPGHPEQCNVFSFHRLLTDQTRVDQIKLECSGAKIGCVECKTELHDNMTKFLAPMREKRKELMSRPEKLAEIVKYGAEKARTVAAKTIAEIKQAIFTES